MKKKAVKINSTLSNDDELVLIFLMKKKEETEILGFIYFYLRSQLLTDALILYFPVSFAATFPLPHLPHLNHVLLMLLSESGHEAKGRCPGLNPWIVLLRLRYTVWHTMCEI